MSHTVQEVARLSGVTIKALHHYHKIGLLVPEWVGANGYRYYSDKDLERLQEILVYRELDFPLRTIKAVLKDGPSRVQCLRGQRGMLEKRYARLANVLATLNEAITHAEKGHLMDKTKLFSGLKKAEWEEVLAAQNAHLKQAFDYDMLVEADIDPDRLNPQSERVERFLTFMAEALREGKPAHDEVVKSAVAQHISYVNDNIYPTTAHSFVEEVEFFLEDDFHREMYEGIQTGLSYYIYTAATVFARAA